VAGVCNTSTHAAVREAVETEKLGVDGILTMMPGYFPLKDQQVVAHFRAIAKAVSCPITLYTNPKFQTWDFTVEALKQLTEEPNILYLKDASGDVGKIMSIVTTLGPRIRIFSDTSSVPLFMFLIGGVGWMSGPACVIPVQSIELYEAAHQKRWEEAAELQKKQWPLNVAFQRFSLSACVKAGLEMQGFPVGPPLPPQKQLDAEGRRTVEGILRSIGAL
jgi:4-hydroxy-tetrahydrodipicolinate synthase